MPFRLAFSTALCLIAMFLFETAGIAEDVRRAPRLPKPKGPVVRVTTEDELQTAVRNIRSNSTIIVARGTYRLTNSLHFTGGVKNVAIRGESGNDEDVVLVGKGMKNRNFGNVPHGIIVGRVRSILIADLTIKDVYCHPITFQGAKGCQNPRVYNCRLVDAGEQFIKSNPGGKNGGVNNGIVEYTVMEYTSTCRGDYTNGVDVHTGRKWIIRNCLFKNIRAPKGKGLAGPSVLMWNRSRDTICEGNMFINCQRGIAFGLSASRADDHRGGIIRNNIFYRSASSSGDAGIALWNSAGTKVFHNTVILSNTYPNAVEYRFSGTSGCEIRYNLCDAGIAARDNAAGAVSDNVTNAGADWFVKPPGGDFHLRKTAKQAIDRVPSHKDVRKDFYGRRRPAGKACDIGAVEHGALK